MATRFQSPVNTRTIFSLPNVTVCAHQSWARLKSETPVMKAVRSTPKVVAMKMQKMMAAMKMKKMKNAMKTKPRPVPKNFKSAGSESGPRAARGEEGRSEEGEGQEER